MRIILFIFLLAYTQFSYAAPKISNAITPVSYFMNHIQELRLLKQRLEAYKTASVVGISGIGKTQFVRLFAKESQDNYKIIWFIDCNLDINQEFIKLAKSINASSNKKLVKETGNEVVQEIKDYLINQKDWLIIFDNIKTSQNKNLKELINWEHNGHVIFSSQSIESLPNVIKLKPLKVEDSRQLVLNLLDEGNENMTSFLANEFKGYPVLVVQGAQLFNKIKGLDKAEYKKKIYQAEDKIKFNIELAIKVLPKTAQNLLFQISLINNQSFSKNFLRSITESSETLNNDLYELSKYLIITNVEADENNPVFEMHDIIAIKIQEIAGKDKNRRLLASMTNSLMKSMPEGVHDGHIFRTSKTVHENFEIISSHFKAYNPSVFTKMELNLYLLTDYLNTSSFDKARPLVIWFEKYKDKGMSPQNMDEYTRYIYIRYLGIVGFYYRLAQSDHNQSIYYYLEAMKIFDTVKGHDDIRNNTIYQLATSSVALGEFDDAKSNIDQMEKMYQDKLVSESEIGLLHLVKAKYYAAQGEYNKALIFVNKDILDSKKHGLNENDKLFTSTYLLKAKILNHLERYDEALQQLEQLNLMFSDQKGTEEIFVYINSQISRAMLGKKQIENAYEYIVKAINILNYKQSADDQNIRFSKDLAYGEAYSIYANILTKLNKLNKAISYYEIAEGIYENIYGKNLNKALDIIPIYIGGAKASCVNNDSFWYKHFYNKLHKSVLVNSQALAEIDKVCKTMSK
jgi:tetratricopeptide (TPR) repeat protein